MKFDLYAESNIDMGIMGRHSGYVDSDDWVANASFGQAIKRVMDSLIEDDIALGMEFVHAGSNWYIEKQEAA